MDNAKFNKYFSAFILIGMAAATIIATAIKFGPSSGPERILLTVSAVGSLLGVAASVTSASGYAITFLFGLFNVLIYGTVCTINWYNGSSGLGTALLHFLFTAPMQVIGFVQWKKRGTNKEGAVKARRLTAGQRWLATGIFLAASLVAYIIIAQFDRSAADTFIKTAVVLDVLPLVCNILGQVLMSTAYMEQWIFWIGVNVFSIAMWSNTLAHDPGSSYAIIYLIKYSFYLINSFNGFRIWLQLSRAASESQGSQDPR
ncbi:MAG: nicotinamide mononucleotide transporter [Bacteroidales bacterium]|nr:nicotinamide mononucleotide transporter [Bacteroidales bacterium]